MDWMSAVDYGAMGSNCQDLWMGSCLGAAGGVGEGLLMGPGSLIDPGDDGVRVHGAGGVDPERGPDL